MGSDFCFKPKTGLRHHIQNYFSSFSMKQHKAVNYNEHTSKYIHLESSLTFLVLSLVYLFKAESKESKRFP
jgi:hypothetical protein